MGSVGWHRAAEEGSCLSTNCDRVSVSLIIMVDPGLSLVLITSLGKHPGCSLSLRRKLPRFLLLQRAV